MARHHIVTVFSSLLSAFGVPALAQAHDGSSGSSSIPGFQWTAWNFEPWVLFCLALSAGLFTAGLRRLWPKVGAGRRMLVRKALAYTGGWLFVAMALVSPLDPLSDVLFSAHMVQHEILILLAAPLLVLSRPIAVALWAFPRGWRRFLVRFFSTGWIGRFWRRATAPFAAWAIHGFVIWTWHAPVFFQAALRHEDVHTLQHLSFFVSALVFWWAIIRGGEGARGYGAGVLYVFSTTVHTSLLGALLTFSRQPWYPAYGGSAAAGLSALEDQQLAGLIMWVPAGAIYLLIALGMFAAWLEAVGKSAGGAAVRFRAPLPRG